MKSVVYSPRQNLNKFKQALKNGRLTIGFLGGSITEARVPHNWPETLLAQLGTHHPDLKITIENAAIGATGSELGLMRVQDDIIAKKPDLVFIEYAVNDWWTPSLDRRRSMEGLIRKLIEAKIEDIILIYTFSREMIPFLDQGSMPPSVQDFETIGIHYGINSIFVGLEAYQQYRLGKFKFESWLPDGLHPLDFGSQIYGMCVWEGLQKFLALPDEPKQTLMPPIDPRHWQSMKLFPLQNITYQYPFVLRRHAIQAFTPYVLSSQTIGSKLSFSFEGRGLLMTFDFGKQSGEIKYQIDQGPWQETKRDRPSWVGNAGWLRTMKLVDNLEFGQHLINLETLASQDGQHWLAHCDIVSVAVLP